MLELPRDLWSDYVQHCCKDYCVGEILLRKQCCNLEGMPNFYRSIFQTWQKVYNVYPDTDISVRSEPVWYNNNLKWKPLRCLQAIWSAKGLRRINDILDRGQVLTKQDFNRKFGTNLTDKTYNFITNLIPEDMKELLLPLNRNINRLGLYIKNDKGILTDIEFISTKVVYSAFLKKVTDKPAAMKKWQDIFSDCEEVQIEANWQFWWSLP